MIRKYKKLILSIVATAMMAGMFGGTARTAEAVAFKDTSQGKLLAELMGIFAQYVKDDLKFQKLGDKEKLDYLVNFGAGIMENALLKTAQDGLKSSLEAYSRKQLMAAAYQRMMGDAMTRLTVNGESAASIVADMNAKAAKEVSTKMMVVKGALDGLDVGWNFYDNWTSGGPQKAMHGLPRDIADKFIEYFVPGWGYFRLSQKLVEAVGQYIMDYAFETAMETKIKDIFPLYADDKIAFAKWVIDKTPAQVRQQVDDNWIFCAEKGWWPGRGNDAGHEKMKNEIVGKIIDMRGSIARQMRQSRIQRQQIEMKVLEARREAQEASDAIKQKVISIRNRVYDKTKPIREYKIKLAEAEVQDIKATAKRHWAQEPIPGDLLNEGAVKEAYRAYYKQLTNSYISTGNKVPRPNLMSFKQIRDKCTPVHKVGMTEDGAQLWVSFRGPAERLILEIQAIIKEADIPRIKFVQEKEPKLQKLAQEVQKTEARFKADIAALEEEGYKSFNDGNFFSLAQSDDANLPKYTTAADILAGPKKTKTVSGTVTSVYEPGMLQNSLDNLLEKAVKIYADQPTASSLTTREVNLWAAYLSQIKSFRGKFESIAPSHLRTYHMDGYMLYSTYSKNSLNEDQIKEYGEEESLLLDGSYSSLQSAILKANTQKGYNSISTESWICDGCGSVDVTPEYVLQQKLKDAQRKAANVKKNYAKAVANYKKAVSELTPLVKYDNKVAEFVGAARAVIYSLQPVNARINAKDFRTTSTVGVQKPILEPREVVDSAGAKMLEEAKKTWQNHKKEYERANALKAGITNRIKYNKNAPEGYFAGLAEFKDTEQRLKNLEKLMEEVRKAIEQEKEAAKKTRADILERIKKADKEEDIEKKIKQLKILVDNFELMTKVYNPEINQAFTERELQNKTKELKKKLAQTEKLLDSYIANKNNAGAAALGGSTIGEVEDADKGEGGQIISWWKPKLTDLRINTYSLAGLGQGEVVISPETLINGKIIITLQADDGIKNLSKILFSNDNGRTWKQIKKSYSLKYEFVPKPNTRYDLKLRCIRADGGGDIIIKLLPAGTYLSYKEINFTQLVLQAIGGVSTAYEKQSIADFSALISREFVGNRSFLEEGVRFDFDMFANIGLVIRVNSVVKKQNKWIAETRWEKKQTPRTTGQVQRTTGTTNFIFIHEDGVMKLYNLRGNLLFATLSPEIAESSGLNSATVDAIRDAKNNRTPTQPAAGEILDAGGVEGATTVGGAAALTVQTTTRQSDNSGWDGSDAFNFENAAWTEAGVPAAAYDLTFEGDMIWENGTAKFEKVATAFNAIDTCPEPAGGVFGANISAGDVYIFKTSEGNYGKLQVTTAVDSGTVDGGGNPIFNIAFKYAIQTDGTTNVHTE